MKCGVRKQLSRRRLKKRRIFCGQSGGAHIVCDYNKAYYVHLKIAIPGWVLVSENPDVWQIFCSGLALYPETLDRVRAAMAGQNYVARSVP